MPSRPAGRMTRSRSPTTLRPWRRLRLRPRMLRDITAIDTSASVLGERLAMPLMVAPTGRHRLFHPDGERATARGAAAAGVPYVLATAATVSIEDVAAECLSAPQWFQLYLPPERSVTEGLIDRVAAAGFRAIVLTVDQPVYGSSPRSARTPLAPSPDIRAVNLPGQPVAAHSYGAAHSGTVTFPATWRDLEWLVAPLADRRAGERRAARRRRAALRQSRRQGHHRVQPRRPAISTRRFRPPTPCRASRQRSARGPRVYVDGGIRRGTDIVKALALGARAVLIGRPCVWGLATGGADGVRDVFTHLRAELARTMALCGVAKLDEVTRDLVA